MDISPEPPVERIGIVPQRPSVIRLEQGPTKVSITVLSNGLGSTYGLGSTNSSRLSPNGRSIPSSQNRCLAIR